MSSADEGSTPPNKKRKLQRACDFCRNKKIRCDGPQMPNNRCSRCIARRVECTYKEAFSKSTYPSSYVENLESRLERMERLVNKLCPDTDLSKELEGSQHTAEASADTPGSAASRASSSRPEQFSSLSPATLGLSPKSPAGSDHHPEDSDEDEDGETEENLTDGLRKLSIESPPYRFHGRSSGMLLLREARQIATGNPWGQEKGHYRHKGLRSPREEPVFDDFPPEDLMDTLVELYFRKINDMLPLLHEPIFKQGIRDGLHLRNGGFGATVLLVCANGARFVRDPRVLLDDSDDWHSAGWRWYQQVEDRQKLQLSPAKLYDLQLCALMVHFLSGSSAPQATWTLIGHGIRRAIDVGAHRRKVYNSNPTIEDELWKRAFWILVINEWTHSYGLGRPSAIHDEDVDVALPTMIDDEYWGSPGQDDIPQQPEGKPSKVAALVSLVRLSQILAFATRTLYPINKSKRTDSSWEQRTVAELDSALNKWIDSLPSHLRWDPNRGDPLHLTQSAVLLGHYYQVQIAVHRPFLSAAYRDSPLSFPSVIICNNAARSTVQVLEIVHKRLGTLYHGSAGLLYMSGAVLMRSIWGQRRSGRTVNVDRDVACMRKAIEMLEGIQYESYVATSARDYLTILVTALDDPPQSPAASSAQKDNGGPEVRQTSTEHVSSSASQHLHGNPPPNYPVAGTSSLPPSTSAHTTQQFDTHNLNAQVPVSLWGEQLSMPRPGHEAGPMRDSVQQQSNQSSSPMQFSFSASMHDLLPDVQHPFSGLSTGGTQNVDASQPVRGAGPMFGLEPLGYSEAASLYPAPSTMTEAGGAGMRSFFPDGAGDQGADMPDFAVLNDTLSVWTNGPAPFGWDEWGAYFNNANDRSSNPGT